MTLYFPFPLSNLEDVKFYYKTNFVGLDSRSVLIEEEDLANKIEEKLGFKIPSARDLYIYPNFDPVIFRRLENLVAYKRLGLGRLSRVYPGSLQMFYESLSGNTWGYDIKDGGVIYNLSAVDESKLHPLGDSFETMIHFDSPILTSPNPNRSGNTTFCHGSKQEWQEAYRQGNAGNYVKCLDKFIRDEENYQDSLLELNPFGTLEFENEAMEKYIDIMSAKSKTLASQRDELFNKLKTLK